MTTPLKPRIGIIGTGAIGGFYGVMLARAGFDVHFLLRSEYQAVHEHGLHIESAVHGSIVLDKVNAYVDLQAMPSCDWVLVGAKTTTNKALVPLINQLAAPNARVILLQNGYNIEEHLQPLLKEGLHLLGGLCFVCAHRKAPGVVVHEAQGMINIGYLHQSADRTIGERITQEVVDVFKEAGVVSNAVPDLQHARWHKLVWNMPFNGLSVLLKSGTSELLAHASSKALLKDLMDEVVLGAKACGHEMPNQLVDMLMLGTERLENYYPSMYHDFMQQRPMELEAMYTEPLAAAKAVGQELPKLEMMYQQLCYLNQTADQ